MAAGGEGVMGCLDDFERARARARKDSTLGLGTSSIALDE